MDTLQVSNFTSLKVDDLAFFYSFRKNFDI